MYSDQTAFLRGHFFSADSTTAETVSPTVIKVGYVIVTGGQASVIVTFREVDDTPTFFTVKAGINETVYVPIFARFNDLEVVADEICDTAVFFFDD